VAATKKISLMVQNVPHKVAFFKAGVAVSNLQNGFVMATTMNTNGSLHPSISASVLSRCAANLEVALALAAAGLPVFPAEISLQENHWRKKPLIRKWQELATTDPEQIKLWWLQFPSAVPGIELRRAGLVVVDPDRHGGVDGVSAFDGLVATHGDVKPHPTTLTPGGGQHHYFKQCSDRRCRNRSGSLPDGIDVRGDGGWIVAPGAVRQDGKTYGASGGAPLLIDAFSTGSIPTIPVWLVAKIHDRRRTLGSSTGLNIAILPPASETTTREVEYARAALEGAAHDLSGAPIGSRNEALNAAAYHLGRMVARGWIDHASVVIALKGAAISAGLDAEEVEKTLASGITAGLSNPAEDLLDHPERRRPVGQAQRRSWPEASKTPNSPKTPTPETPRIRLVRGERARVADEAAAVLRGRREIFERGGELVRVAGGGIEPVTVDWLTDYHDRNVEFTAPRKNKEDDAEEPRDAPEWLARRIMSKREECGICALRGLITAPTMRADGTLVVEPGYDLATGLLLVAASRRPLIPDKPSIEELRTAGATLWRPFADFPFVDKTARSVLLAAILTAVVRQTLGLAPAFSFDAPLPAAARRCWGIVSWQLAAWIAKLFPNAVTRKRSANACCRRSDPVNLAFSSTTFGGSSDPRRSRP
jgi:Bifunctional DNA primase/polymerase, N-terminal